MSRRLDELAAGEAGETAGDAQLSSDKITDKGRQPLEKDALGSRVSNKDKTLFRDHVGDLNAETMGADFLPATLGTNRSDTNGGVFFVRQPILRWSQPLDNLFNFHIGLEDPSSSDISSSQTILGDTSIPDVIAGVEYSPSELWHLRLNGMVRRIGADIPNAGEDEATAWGLSLTGHYNVFQTDKLSFSGLYGEGLGRYLLGIQSTAGSVLDPMNNELVLRDNYGGMISYLHHWNASLRSTAMAGAAFSDSYDWQPGNTFERSIYGSVNLMWRIKPFITLGVEYAYGSLENKDGSDLDNHRVAVGIQVYYP
jgi:hypothetical protein